MRLLLILLLAIVMDLGAPVLPGGDMEEFEEAAHGRRRLARLASAALPGTVAVADPARRVAEAPRPVVSAAPRRPPVAPPLKLAPRVTAAPPSSPDDH
jgi:hypothetical protein